MSKYVVFYQNEMMRQYVVNDLTIHGASGYLECLLSQGVIQDIKVRVIESSLDLETMAWGDEKLIDILKEIKAKSYLAIKAEVLNEDKLKEVLPRLCSLYSLVHRFYENEGKFSPKK